MNRNFVIGEKVLFQKNDKSLGIQNGLTGTIRNISNATLKIKTDKGKKLNISQNNYLYLNYGYALTVHKSQGQTCDKVLYVSKSDDITKTQSLYAGATRAKHDITVYTDNIVKTKESLR